MAKFFDGKYPVIFIHGMFGWGAGEGINSVVPYWGATTGDLEVFGTLCRQMSATTELR